MVRRVAAILAATALFGSATGADVQDLQRAVTKKPRNNFKGEGQVALSKVLNGHIRRSEAVSKACDAWNPQELQDFMLKVLENRSPELDDIYQQAEDRRRLHLKEESTNVHEVYKADWARSNEALTEAPHLEKPLRDSHCRQAVMWWTHHLTEGSREELRTAGVVVPLLPEEPKAPCEPGSHQGGKALCAGAEISNSCDWCHSLQSDSDKPGNFPPNALEPQYSGPDDGNPHGWDRNRRCDQDYKSPMCGICEGVGGECGSDKNEDIKLATCIPLQLPQDVNMSTVAKPIYPKQWTHRKYHDQLIGRKTDPFCFGFFPENNSSGTLCYRSEDAYVKYFDIEREAVRTDYNVKMHGAFGLFGNITSNVTHVGRYMWITNQLWLGMDQCICTDPGRVHCTHTPNCPSYAWHYDFAKTAQYLGREKVGVEWLGEMELDHFILWAHHIWTDPISQRMVRLWKPWNGLQIYDPTGWQDSIDDPTSVFESPPAMCKKGGAKIRIHCDDDGNYNPSTSEGEDRLKDLIERMKVLTSASTQILV